MIGIPVYRCSSRKETETKISCSEKLHLMIAFLLALKPVGLNGDEARYLRKHLGYTAEELAHKIGVMRIAVTRWKTGEGAIKPDHDKHLRRLYLDKKKSDLRKLPAVNRILPALVDFLPLN